MVLVESINLVLDILGIWASLPRFMPISIFVTRYFKHVLGGILVCTASTTPVAFEVV
jgi:hypothetical protein